MNRIFDNNDLILHCLSFIIDDETIIECRRINKYLSLVYNIQQTSNIIFSKFANKLNTPAFMDYICQMSHNSAYSIICRFEVLKQLMYFIFSRFKLHYLHYDVDYFHKIHFGERYENFLNIETCQNDAKSYSHLFNNLASVTNNYNTEIRRINVGNHPFIILSLSSQVKALVY